MSVLLPIVYTIVVSAVVFVIFSYFHARSLVKEKIKTFYDLAHSVGLSKHDIDYDELEWRIKNYKLTECIDKIKIERASLHDEELVFLALLNRININDESIKKVIRLISVATIKRIISNDEAMFLREQIYPGLSRCIRQERTESDDVNCDAPRLYKILFLVKQYLEEIYKRQEEEEIDETNISVRDESFAEFNADGSIKFLGHNSIIDYDKHDMDFDGIKEKTLQEFYKLAKLFSLDAYKCIYKEAESTLKNMNYDACRYSHGEFHPPDMIACDTVIYIVERKIEPDDFE